MSTPLPAPEPRRGSCAPWAALVLLALIAAGTFVFLKLSRRGEEALKLFATGTITHTFVSRATEVQSTHGDILEVATLRSDELFRREEARSVLWNRLYLGTTVAEIRAPVTFRYHLRLSDSWRLATRGNVCLVQAPPVRATQPPALHTEAMEKQTSNGWARFDAEASLQELERSITPELEKRAADAAHGRLVREASRQAVAEFVKRWLMKEDQWREDRFSAIVVVFPDEQPLSSDTDLERVQAPPTIRR